MANWQPCNYALASEAEADAWVKKMNAKNPGAYWARQKSKKRWVGLVDRSKIKETKK